MSSHLKDASDLDLVTRLREHVGGDDENVSQLLDEILIRLLRHTAYLARSRWVLAALLHEASEAAGHGEESHEMLLEQLGDVE
jgi:DNA-directed RNA polymerase specialized sigma24 family protein